MNAIDILLESYTNEDSIRFMSYRSRITREPLPPALGVEISGPSKDQLYHASIRIKLNDSQEQQVAIEAISEGSYLTTPQKKRLQRAVIMLFLYTYNKEVTECLTTSKPFSASVPKEILLPKKRPEAQDTYVSPFKIQKYNHLISQDYQDYVKYSREHLLTQGVQVFFNVVPDNIPEVVSFDSEGMSVDRTSCALAQIATDECTVYLFTNMEIVKPILQNPNVKKLVFCGEAEQSVFPGITNVYDLQDKNESFCSRLEDVFGVKLIKDKTIHANGWIEPFTLDQLDYSVADVIWSIKLYNAKPDLRCRGSC